MASLITFRPLPYLVRGLSSYHSKAEQVRITFNKQPLKIAAFVDQAKTVKDDVFMAADTESTGIFPDEWGTHGPINIGLVVSRNGLFETSHNFFINPNRPCSKQASKIHGVNDSFLRRFPPLVDVAPVFVASINQYPNVPLWFHNAPFDVSLIQRSFNEHGLNYSPADCDNPVYCSLQLARAFRGNEKGLNTLDALCEYYGVSLSKRAQGHGALVDSELLADCLPLLAEDFLNSVQEAGISKHAEALIKEMKSKPLSAKSRKSEAWARWGLFAVLPKQPSILEEALPTSSPIEQLN